MLVVVVVLLLLLSCAAAAGYLLVFKSKKTAPPTATPTPSQTTVTAQSFVGNWSDANSDTVQISTSDNVNFTIQMGGTTSTAYFQSFSGTSFSSDPVLIEPTTSSVWSIDTTSGHLLTNTYSATTANENFLGGYTPPTAGSSLQIGLYNLSTVNYAINGTPPGELVISSENSQFYVSSPGLLSNIPVYMNDAFDYCAYYPDNWWFMYVLADQNTGNSYYLQVTGTSHSTTEEFTRA